MHLARFQRFVRNLVRPDVKGSRGMMKYHHFIRGTVSFLGVLRRFSLIVPTTRGVHGCNPLRNFGGGDLVAISWRAYENKTVGKITGPRFDLSFRLLEFWFVSLFESLAIFLREWLVQIILGVEPRRRLVP